MKPLSASAWCLQCNCLSLRGQTLELRHLSSANDQADQKLSFGPPSSETPASSYLWTDSRRHRVTSAWFPSGTVSPLPETALSLSCIDAASLWNVFLVHLTNLCFCPSLDLITESNHLANPALVIFSWSKVVSSHTNSKMLNGSSVKCIFHRPLTLLLIIFRWLFNGQD